jgi:anaerobic magnesium-protoporphyrin IX monomethyl ester cyclase
MHITVFPQKTVPLGLLSVASYVRSRRPWEIRLLDGFQGDDPEALAEAAASFQPHLVGISGLTAHAYDSMVAAELVRGAAPDAMIIAAGTHFSGVPEESLRLCPYLDAVVVGEGEQTLLELGDWIEQSGGRSQGESWKDGLSEVPGMTWLDGDPADPERPFHQAPPRKLLADLGDLHMPAWDLAHPERYRMHPWRWRELIMMEGSRGCPYACTFCHTTQFWKQRWRPRPVEAVLDDIEEVVRRWGRRAVHFTDDSWATQRKRVIAFCEGVLERGLDIDLWAQCRVDDLYRDRDLFPLMKRAGFYGFLVGFESGEQATLDRWDKGVAVDKARELAPELSRHFQSILGTFFIGDLQTDVDSFERTRAFADELNVDVFIEAPLNLFPPTVPIWSEYRERPDFALEWDYDLIGNCKVVLPTDHLTQDQVLYHQKRNMLSFYAHPAKAFHAFGSGRYARRQFLNMPLTVVEEALRGQASRWTQGLRTSRTQQLRERYRHRHDELVQTRRAQGQTAFG